jgi:hypothetical protein
MQLMLRATVCDCPALDPFAFEEDGLSAPEVDVSRGKIVEALVIAGMVVMRHEGGDLAFEIAGQVVVLKQDGVLDRDQVSDARCLAKPNQRGFGKRNFATKDSPPSPSGRGGQTRQTASQTALDHANALQGREIWGPREPPPLIRTSWWN